MIDISFNKLTGNDVIWPLLIFIPPPWWSSSVSSCNGEVPEEILLPLVFLISGHEYALRTLFNENSGPFLGLLSVLCPKIKFYFILNI